MRRIIVAIVGCCMLSAGVGCWHTAGICDCRCDDNCAEREPWIQVIQGGGRVVTTPAPAALPEKMPAANKL